MDNLKFSKNSHINKMLEPDERIVFTGIYKKYNPFQKLQKRNLLITERNIYSLKDTSTRRKIPIAKLRGITRSKHEVSREFVLHVEDEYDYRCEAECHNLIIRTLQTLYFEYFDKDLPIYEVNDTLLEDYVTSKEDVNDNINNMPEAKFLVPNIPPETEADEGKTTLNTLVIYSTMKDIIPLSAFNKLKKICNKENETIYLVKYKDEFFMLKKIRSTSYTKFEDVDKMYIEEEVNRVEENPFIYVPQIVYKGNDVIFLIFKFAVEMTLAQLLEKEKRMSERKVRFFAYQIAYALSHLHHIEMTYSFLTIDKILIDRNGYININYFNTYRLLPEKEKGIYIKSIKYKQYYTRKHLEPEYLSTGKITPASNWWDLGIIVYELLVGKLIFNSGKLLTTQKFWKGGERLVLSFPGPFEHFVFMTDVVKRFISDLLTGDSKKRLNRETVFTHIFLKSKELDVKALVRKELDLTTIFLMNKDKTEFKFENCAEEPITKIYPTTLDNNA